MLCAKMTIAQNTQYLHKANVLFTAGSYYDAAESYKKYLGLSTDKGSFKPYTVKRTTRKQQPTGNELLKALYNLAECYRKLNMHADAEKTYAEIIRKDAKQYPETRLWYGTSLRANQKYDEAEKQLNLCLTEQASNKTITALAQQELDNLAFISTQLSGKEQANFNIGKLASPINNKNGNYAVSLIGDSLLLFTSTRIDTAIKKEVPHTNRLYRLSVKDTARQLEPIVIAAIDKANHQGTSSVTADGKRFYFSVWEQQSNQSLAAIYMCQRDPATGTLGNPVKLLLNVDGYSSMQPSVSPNGSYIFFSSNRPNGLGSNDIWYAATDANGNAQKAINAGPAINTAYDEQAPFYHAASNTLVFSSNGRTGMGGLDFFASKGAIGNWEQATNMGYPINSVKDDVYFFSNAKDSLLQQAYISTDRTSDCCLEIYTVSKTYTPPQPKLFKHNLTGTVSDQNTKASLKEVSISLNSNGQQAGNTASNEQGNFFFNLKEQDSTLHLSFSKVGYTSLDTVYSMPTIQDSDRNLAIQVYLAPLGKDPQPVVTDSTKTETKQAMPGLIYFDFGSYVLTSNTKKTLDALAAMLNSNKDLHIEVGGHTDAKGTVAYNLKLSAARAQACINYLIEKGINKERLHLHAYGECCPIAPEKINNNDNPAGRKQNRRVEFKINQLAQ